MDDYIIWPCLFGINGGLAAIGGAPSCGCGVQLVGSSDGFPSSYFIVTSTALLRRCFSPWSVRGGRSAASFSLRRRFR